MHTRKSNIELLRIIATVMITLNHIPISDNALTANYLVQRFFFLGGQTGVNLYVIIGAWFLVEKRFKAERVVRLIAQTIFYILLLDVVTLFLGTKFTFALFIKSFKNWFCFGYLAMLLLTPLFYKLKRDQKKVIVIAGAAVSVCMTVAGFIIPEFFLVKLFMKGLFIGPVWFSYVFILISYLKTSEKSIRVKRPNSLVVFATGYLIMYIVLLVTHNSTIREVHSPFTLICALALFFWFLHTDIEYKPIINNLASYTFGVCLLQIHQILRNYIWISLFHFPSVSESTILFIPLSLLSVCMIFLFTVIMDTLRKKFEDLKPVKSLRDYICRIIDRLFLYFSKENTT